MKKLVYSVAVGNVDITNPDSVKAITMISKMNGFVAIHPHYPDGTLCLFHSLKSAQEARQLISEQMMCQVGNNICEFQLKKGVLIFRGQAK